MNRVAGIETEYGCLLSGDDPPGAADAWPVRVKNHLFRSARLGAIDLHYRDYEEPPGNGGFLLNGGRLYIDMGHLEYSTPECLDLRDMVAYEMAGDAMLQSALESLGVAHKVAFIKNNIDHHTGATFGCHENYLMKRDLQFTPRMLGTLLSFLATRQIFSGAGRVGQANPLAFDFEPPDHQARVDYQISQRADHIVNDIYQWVQFNRAIINARDEPLADYRRYRRLHLLIGDSNMSPFANALKIGTTACLLSMLEDGFLPDKVVLADAVQATRDISRAPDGPWLVETESGGIRDALDIQVSFLETAQKFYGASPDEETKWILDSWSYTLAALRRKPELLIGGVDWISKKWLLETFIEAENLDWSDPWLQSLDLQYHDVNPAVGLFHGLSPAKAIGEFNDKARNPEAVRVAPANSRAHARGVAVAHFQQHDLPYIINWDSIALENQDHLSMGDPFCSYGEQVAKFLKQK